MSIGEKLRRIRETQGISLRELARRVGVSPSLISQIEHGQVNPSLSTLQGIGKALEEDISIFADDKAPLNWILVKERERRIIYSGQEGVSIELMAFPGPRDKKMRILLITLSPASIFTVDMLPEDPERETEDDFLYLISGGVSVTTDKRQYRMEPGDASYLTYERLNSIASVGQQESKMLWCACRPS